MPDRRSPLRFGRIGENVSTEDRHPAQTGIQTRCRREWTIIVASMDSRLCGNDTIADQG
jgi:hypothetical protein